MFKILSAIAEEIEVLRQSTEQRFQALETLINVIQNMNGIGLKNVIKYDIYYKYKGISKALKNISNHLQKLPKWPKYSEYT